MTRWTSAGSRIVREAAGLTRRALTERGDADLYMNVPAKDRRN